jgi:hypothetical protein
LRLIVRAVCLFLGIGRGVGNVASVRGPRTCASLFGRIAIALRPCSAWSCHLATPRLRRWDRRLTLQGGIGVQRRVRCCLTWCSTRRSACRRPTAGPACGRTSGRSRPTGTRGCASGAATTGSTSTPAAGALCIHTRHYQCQDKRTGCHGHRDCEAIGHDATSGKMGLSINASLDDPFPREPPGFPTLKSCMSDCGRLRPARLPKSDSRPTHSGSPCHGGWKQDIGARS